MDCHDEYGELVFEDVGDAVVYIILEDLRSEGLLSEAELK